jgi:hypothetical protein
MFKNKKTKQKKQKWVLVSFDAILWAKIQRAQFLCFSSFKFQVLTSFALLFFSFSLCNPNLIDLKIVVALQFFSLFFTVSLIFMLRLNSIMHS